MNGAYIAGVLKGWTSSGTRPRFDVVTGISTGALIAPFAFLGPEYDAELERLYTSMRRENILRPRLFWLDSVASSEPLEQRIAAGATPDILRRIAEAHRQGRRLYVGTTNLDAKRLVVWDLGGIAARNSEESRVLFQKVLLALGQFHPFHELAPVHEEGPDSMAKGAKPVLSVPEQEGAHS